jgi:branched-chain amino acid transport system substrate-binding protein
MKKSLAIAAAGILALAGCAGSGSGGDGDVISIGASLPLTGPLAAFGTVLQDGYQAAVDEVNEAGGIEIDGTTYEVDLVVLDSASDPNIVSEQTRALVEQNEVVGLLGSISPGLTIPASNVAELEQIPLVSSLTPVQSWKAGNADGWTYAWDLFFDELQQTEVPFEAADLVDTNKKVALFTDNEEDGIAMGALWNEKAPELGYEIAYHAEFPVGTTDYASYINEAKAAGAEIVITQMIPPDAFALWKQMKALAFVPKIAFCEKCSSQAAFQAELGPIAEATSSSYITAPSATGDALRAEFAGKYGETVDLTSVLASYTAAKVLLDAIAAAGSTDPAAINEAIGATDAEYPVGDVTFDDGNAFAITAVALQWLGAAQVQVSPAVDGVDFVTPVTGLQ